MGLFDFLSAAPSSQQAMQAQGLFGGLQALGAGLAQAGQYRPAGQAGPGLAEAFLGFQRGNREGLLGAYQQSRMDREQKRRGLLVEAQSNLPDDQISPEARQMRTVITALPSEVRAFADEDNLPQLALRMGTEKKTPMTPDQLSAAGFRPGTVGYTDWLNNPTIAQQSDVKSPEAMRQRMQEIAASRAPTDSWVDERDDSGNVIGQRNRRTGQFQPINAPAMNTGRAMNIIATLGPRVASGDVLPGTPQFEQYVAAYTVATAPKTTFEQAPDPNNPGQVITIPKTQPALNVPSVFPNPMDLLARAQGGQGGQPAPAPAAAQPTPAQAPAAAPQGVPVGQTGMTATPPPSPSRITPAMAEKVRAGEEEARKVQMAVDNYIAALSKHGAGLGTWLNNPRDPRAQEVLGAYERVKMIMRGEGLMNTGVLNPGEIPIIEKALMAPDTFRGMMATPEVVRAKLGEFTKQVLDNYNIRREQAGLPPLQSLPGAPGRSGGAGGGWSIRPVQ